MFISEAYAQTADATAGSTDLFVQFMPLILIFAVFYVLIIRPQQKRMKEHRATLQSLRRGDRVVTGGGLLGTVVNVGTDDEVTVEIADNVKVKVLRPTIQSVIAKTEPVKGDKAGGDKPASGASKLFGRK